jgi:hypothetical protein
MKLWQSKFFLDRIVYALYTGVNETLYGEFKMAKMTYTELNEALDAAITAGEIYNVSFNEWKTYGGSRMLEADIDAIREEFTYAGKWESRMDDEMAIIDALNYNITQFPSKKLEKALETVMNHSCENPVMLAVDELVDKWEVVGDKFRTLKGMIVKGRKPSTTPRVTPVRTLDNTGTCPVCGANVKMSGGKIVSHGFTIKYGWQEGNCFGVGYDPIEVSDEGVVAYRAMILDMVQDRVMSKIKLITNRLVIIICNDHGEVVISHRDGEDGYQRILDLRCMNIDSDIRHMNRDIAMRDKMIKVWKAQPLPDAMKEVA